jgi:hypothetical protein
LEEEAVIEGSGVDEVEIVAVWLNESEEGWEAGEGGVVLAGRCDGKQIALGDGCWASTADDGVSGGTEGRMGM